MLRSNGHYLLVSFDRLELNPVPMRRVTPSRRCFPTILLRTWNAAHSAHVDPALIERDLLAAGFTRIQLETVALTAHVSASDAAPGLVLGSPFRSEIERRDSSALDRALNAVTAALAVENDPHRVFTNSRARCSSGRSVASAPLAIVNSV